MRNSLKNREKLISRVASNKRGGWAPTSNRRLPGCGVAAAVTVSDGAAGDAMPALAAGGDVAGESGAAELAGARAVLARPDARARLVIDAATTIALVNTKGATDRESYKRIVGTPPY